MLCKLEGAFWVAVLEHFARRELQPFVIDVAGRRYEAAFALLANAASYAGGRRIAPRASMGERSPGSRPRRLDRAGALCAPRATLEPASRQRCRACRG
jgi:hypothetical protein